MKTLVKTLLWMLVLLATAAYVGHRYFVRMWNSRDALFKQQVLAGLQKWLPDADLELEAVRYDFGHEVLLTGLRVTPPHGHAAIVHLPETVIHIQREMLLERQLLDVQKVVLKSPRLEFVRGRDGRWNWQAFELPQSDDKGCLPEVVIEDGTIVLRVEQSPGVLAGVLVLEHVDVDLLPSGKRQYLITATSRCEHTGNIRLTGRWHIDQHTGQIDGEFTQIHAGQELVGIAASFVPEVRTTLAEWETKFREFLNRPAALGSTSPFSMPTDQATAESGEPISVGAADSILGLKAEFNLTLRVARPDANSSPMFRVSMNIADGEVTNPVLPFPLGRLNGELYADNDQIVIKNLTAQNGATKVTIDGKLEGRAEGFPGRLEVTVDNVACDQRLRSRLSAGFGRMYDQTNPIGDLDLHAFLVYDGQRWRPEGLLATAKDCSVIHDAFRYPVEQVNGTVRQEGRDLIVDMQGLASGRPISLTGTVVNPGPEATVMLTVRATDLPINKTFLEACHPQLRAAIEKLRLSGRLSGEVRLAKAPRQPFVPRIDVTIRDGAIAYEQFQYDVSGITGRLLAIGPHFEFQELVGQHGSVRITAAGSFQKLNPQTSELKLRIGAQGAALDESLYRAVPTSIRRLWAEFRPTGTIDVITDVEWITNRPAVITMPSLEWKRGSLTLKSLPYPLSDAQGSFTYGPDDRGQPRVLVKSLTARHGEMQLAASGWSVIEPDGEWRAHLDHFVVENLTPDREFLDAHDALPGLKQLFSNFDPQQPLKLEGVLDFRGANEPETPITAAWDIDTYFSGGAIRTGLDFKNLRGKVRSRGTWDGSEVNVRGDVELSSARILDYDLADVRGPFRVYKGTLMFGAGDTLRQRPVGTLTDRDRLTAKVFGGTLLMDGAVSLTDNPHYRVQMQLRDGSLEKFAAQHAPKQRDLRGVLNGWVSLEGQGSNADAVRGQGQLQISPAALLDMPVVLQMYRGLSLTPPENYAFNYALLDFRIQYSRFIFNNIRLDGSTLSFLGSGTVDFDSNVNLKMYSMLPRNQIPIPLLHELVGEATKGWVQIDVTGKLSQPKTNVKAASPLDDALRNLQRFVPQPVLPIGQGLPLRAPVRQ
jgi:hypothetical protein